MDLEVISPSSDLYAINESCDVLAVVEIDDAPGLTNAPEIKWRLRIRGLSERGRYEVNDARVWLGVVG
jgi:hypothetical protein